MQSVSNLDRRRRSRNELTPPAVQVPWWNVSSGEFLGLPAQITAWMAVAAADVIKLSVYVIPWPGSPPPQRALSPIWAPWINVRQQVELLEPDNRKEKRNYLRIPNNNQPCRWTLLIEGVDLVGDTLRSVLDGARIRCICASRCRIDDCF